MELTDLTTDDAPTIQLWLVDYLTWHLAVWSRACGSEWTPSEISGHLARENLVAREWAELVEAAADPARWVGVLRDAGVPVGIAYAEARTDRYLLRPIGVVSWVFVAPTRRLRGHAASLVAAAHAWMTGRGLTAAELFVTGANTAALRLYARLGYAITDARMLAPLRPAAPPDR